MQVYEYDITEKMYTEWVMETKKEGRKLVFMILWFVLFVACFAMFFIYNHDTMCLIFALFCLYMGFFRDFVSARVMYNRAVKMQESGKWHRIIRVSDEEIVIDDGKMVVNYKTSDIVRKEENDKRIRIFMKDGTSVRLYKESLLTD